MSDSTLKGSFPRISTIDRPASVQKLNVDGTVDASGTCGSGVLTAIWGKVFSGCLDDAQIPCHPWDSNAQSGVVKPKEGVVGNNNAWSISGLSGAQGSCHEDTFVAWYALEDVDGIRHEPQYFRSYMTGSPCSGSTGSGGISGWRRSTAPLSRRYRIKVVKADSLPPALKSVVDSGLLQLADVVVEHDATQSSENNAVFVAKLGSTVWRMSVVDTGHSLTATLVVQETGTLILEKPQVWQCAGWQSLQKNTLKGIAIGRGNAGAFDLEVTFAE